MRTLVPLLALLFHVSAGASVKCSVERIVVDFGQHRSTDRPVVDSEGYVAIRCSNSSSAVQTVSLSVGLTTGQSNNFGRRLLRYSGGRRDQFVRYNMFLNRQRTQVWTDTNPGRYQQSLRLDAFDSLTVEVPVYLRTHLRGFGLAGNLTDSVQAIVSVN